MGIDILQDPAMLVLGIYPKDPTHYYKVTCSSMFTATLFIIARNLKKPSCPSTDGWIMKIQYMPTIEYYSAIKKI